MENGKSKTIANKSKLKGRIGDPLFIPASKDGRLAAAMKKKEEELCILTGWSYKVVEKGGFWRRVGQGSPTGRNPR